MNLIEGMARAGRILALTLGWAAAGPAAALDSAPAASPPALVVLGDSLSAGYGIRVEEGWVALLEARLRSEGYGYRVVNASVSGETSAGGLARLPRVLAVHHPELLVVELGANDGLRGLPVADLRRNLAAIVATARAAHARVLLVGIRIPTNYGPEYTGQFYASFGAVARASRVPLVPFLLEGIAEDERNFQADRLHPVAAAEPRVLDNVWKSLAPLLRRPPRAVAGAP